MPSTLWLELCVERGLRKSLVEREGWARQWARRHPGGKEPTCCLPGRKPFPVVHSASR